VLYLAYAEGLGEVEALEGPWLEVHPLRPDLLLIDSEQGRSAVYHALKGHLPKGTPVLVAEVERVPKFAHMAAGALAWARERAPR
jgi:hypothetical protein